MAPRRSGNDDFDPTRPSARDIRISRQPKGRPTLRATSSGRIQDRRGEPQRTPDQIIDDILSGKSGIDPDAYARYINRPLSPAGRQMMTPERNLGLSTQLNRNGEYSSSMAANLNAYFNRLMTQPSPEQGTEVRYEDGSVGFPNGPRSRYGEVPYQDLGKTQQEFREAQRQAMLRDQARRILEGGQPSTSQMLNRSRQNPAIPDIADYFVDPIHGQDDRRQYPNGDRYYEAGNVPTLAAALAERRNLRPSTSPPGVQVEDWNRGAFLGGRNRPFPQRVTDRYRR